MTAVSFFAGLSLGFLGSVHCIGMCGPLALALPVRQTKGLHRISLLLVYHLSRTATYAGFGLILGWAGERLLWFGWQQGLSVFMGTLLLLSVAGFWLWKRNISLLNPVYEKISALYRTCFKQGPGYSTFMILGALNGLLPCGLVYVAWGGAASWGSAVSGALLMVGFGLGTLPALFALPYISGWLAPRMRRNLQKLSPVVVSLTALLLILRGLNLGIPYVSPQMDPQKKEVRACCSHKKTCH